MNKKQTCNFHLNHRASYESPVGFFDFQCSLKSSKSDFGKTKHYGVRFFKMTATCQDDYKSCFDSIATGNIPHKSFDNKADNLCQTLDLSLNTLTQKIV